MTWALASVVAVLVTLVMLTLGEVMVSTWVSVALAELSVARRPTAPMKPAAGTVPEIGVALPVSSVQLPLPSGVTE